MARSQSNAKGRSRYPCRRTPSQNQSRKTTGDADGKLKQEKPLPKISPDEVPFSLPANCAINLSSPTIIVVIAIITSLLSRKLLTTFESPSIKKEQ
ncbi:MAG: hypothetical protein ACYT04_19910 [Nostoc sp.]